MIASYLNQMSRPSRISRTRPTTKQLGPILHRLRTERGIPSIRLSKETGLSPSYLNYVETGHFKDIGLEKFVRLIQALRVSADEILAKAGYLAQTAKTDLPEPQDYLRERYRLSPAQLEVATDFLDYLARKARRRPATEREARRRSR